MAVHMAITVENEEHKQQMISVLGAAEEEGSLPFDFNVQTLCGPVHWGREELISALELAIDTGFPVTDEYGHKHWAISEVIRARCRAALQRAKEARWATDTR